MIWLDLLLDRAPYPCICNADYPNYGKTLATTSSGSYFVKCRSCYKTVFAANRKDAIYKWDNLIARELEQG